MQSPYDYFQEFFRVNHLGKPEPKFPVWICSGPDQEILNPRHSVHILPHLQKIDTRISALLELVADRAATPDPGPCYDDLLRLHRHAEKLFQQAVYLDTKDRDSWGSIQERYTTDAERARPSSRLADLKAFWKGRLEQILEAEADQAYAL